MMAQMVIGKRLRQLRESKKFSQGDIEKRAGLLRCYISRVENGHTIPTVATLQKYAMAVEVPMYKLFHEGNKPPEHLKLPSANRSGKVWGDTDKERQELRAFARLLSRMDDGERKLLFTTAQWMSRHSQK